MSEYVVEERAAQPGIWNVQGYAYEVVVVGTYGVADDGREYLIIEGSG